MVVADAIYVPKPVAARLYADAGAEAARLLAGIRRNVLAEAVVATLFPGWKWESTTNFFGHKVETPLDLLTAPNGEGGTAGIYLTPGTLEFLESLGPLPSEEEADDWFRGLARNRAKSEYAEVMQHLRAGAGLRDVDTFIWTERAEDQHAPFSKTGDLWAVFRSTGHSSASRDTPVLLHQSALREFFEVVRDDRAARPTAAYTMQDINEFRDRVRAPPGKERLDYIIQPGDGEMEMNNKEVDAFADAVVSRIDARKRRSWSAAASSWALVAVTLFAVAVAIWTVLHNDHHADTSDRLASIEHSVETSTNYIKDNSVLLGKLDTRTKQIQSDVADLKARVDPPTPLHK